MSDTKRFRTSRTKGARIVTTYEKLRAYLRAFADGHFGLVILIGECGLAKSRTVRNLLSELGQDYCWIEGNATPYGMFEKLFRHRDQIVVIDDVDSLYADRSGVRLLKCLCQTQGPRIKLGLVFLEGIEKDKGQANDAIGIARFHGGNPWQPLRVLPQFPSGGFSLACPIRVGDERESPILCSISS